MESPRPSRPETARAALLCPSRSTPSTQTCADHPSPHLSIPCSAALTVHESANLFRGSLAEEYPGILAWMVSGVVKWWNRGKPSLREPERVRAATEEYRSEEDVLGQ